MKTSIEYGNKNAISHVIWDFNGTLLDDVQAEVNTINSMLKKRGLQEFENIDQYRNAFFFPIAQFYQSIGLASGREDLSLFGVERAEVYDYYAKNVTLRPGAREGLAMLSEQNISQTLLSGTETGVLNQQVDNLKISHYFIEIMGSGGLSALDKKGNLSKILSSQKPLQATMIGDTTNDYFLAENAHLPIVLLSGGHQASSKLSECDAPLYDTVLECVHHVLSCR